MKERFREENKHSPQKLKLLELVSQPGTEQLAAAAGARFIKTHLPLSLLPPALLDHGKMVYVARDPRDVVVSFYHLNRSMRTQGYVGDFKTYWNYFIRDLRKFTCVVFLNISVVSLFNFSHSMIGFSDHWTPYFDHLKEAWEKRHHPNMLFLFYEELSKVRGSARRS